MGDDEVVEARLGAGREGGGVPRGFGLETLHGADVGEALGFGEGAPGVGVSGVSEGRWKGLVGVEKGVTGTLSLTILF